MSERNNKGRFTAKHIDDRDAGELEAMREDTFKRFEKTHFWNPTGIERLKSYLSHCNKMAKQHIKTLDAEGRGVEHSRDRKVQLRQMSKWWKDEAKRVQDKIDDGGR